MHSDSTLDELSQASASVKRAEAELSATVIAARKTGASWAQIGAALGMTRQSAHERWGHLARGGCQRRDCDCPSHDPGSCHCGHGPGRGRTATA